MNSLRTQFERCRVAARKPTGVGFFTQLHIPDDAEPAPVKPGRMSLGNVVATVDGLQHGAGFVLFVENGVLDMLEGFSYDEPWLDVRAAHVVTAGGARHGGGTSLSDTDQVDAAWDGSPDGP
jgi:hypothetical protein